MLLPLETPLDQIKGIGPKFIVKLKSLKIETVKDLLWHFPNRYEDFSKVYPISELTAHQEATVTGIVESINVRRSWRRHFVLTEAVISDYSGSIRAVWFNQPYLRNILQPGREFNFSGKIVASSTNNDLCFSNPIYEFINSDSLTETKHTARLVPIYPETRGLTSKTLRYLIKPLLEQIMEPLEILPADILKKRKFPELKKALRDVHFPDDINDALEAKKRFAFESLFLWQLVILRQKFHLARQKAISIKYDLEEIKRNLKRLPFELTQSQKKSLWEILQDIEKSRPMNRLLQGDVGSGKTIIAAMAAIATAANDKQTAFMAPTEILARQHYQTLIKFFPEFEKGIALLTGQEAKVFYGDNLETKTKKTELTKDIAAGKIKIIVGTHALIQKTISFKELALVIVDEQHRFGIKQRAELLKNSQTGKPVLPHFLSMSATPIPRTLSLTLFGDLDLSLITELPKDRKPIITKTVAPNNRNNAYQFIREQIKNGRQAFVICPRIQPATDNEKMSADLFGKMEMKNVSEEYEKLKNEIFPDLKIAKIHGRLPAKEKEAVMNSFKNKESDILVATSVIEVGIDIPNAVIMMIEGAERFGLAQLYQFRGRVGRSEHQSYCFLFSDSPAKTVQQRLQSIAEAKNGFELAEKDLEIRGPGEFLGETQTGIPDLAMKALKNPEMVKGAREAALKIIERDYLLKTEPILRKNVEKFGHDIHQE